MRSEIGGEDSLLRRVEVKARKSSFFQTTEELRPSETRRMAARAARGGEVVVGITGDTNEGYGRPGKTEREAATTYGGYAAAGEKERSPESRNRSSSLTRPSTLSAMVLANYHQPHAHRQTTRPELKEHLTEVPSPRPFCGAVGMERWGTEAEAQTRTRRRW